MFRKSKKEHDDEKRRRIPLLGKILMVIGFLTVLYFFITEILMRILANLTPKG